MMKGTTLQEDIAILNMHQELELQNRKQSCVYLAASFMLFSIDNYEPKI